MIYDTPPSASINLAYSSFYIVQISNNNWQEFLILHKDLQSIMPTCITGGNDHKDVEGILVSPPYSPAIQGVK